MDIQCPLGNYSELIKLVSSARFILSTSLLLQLSVTFLIAETHEVQVSSFTNCQAL
jgi:hypothetical protein